MFLDQDGYSELTVRTVWCEFLLKNYLFFNSMQYIKKMADAAAKHLLFLQEIGKLKVCEYM